MNSSKSTHPIIIGGVHRSGTSLVRRILNAHSNIYCGPEVKFFKEWCDDYIDVDDPIKFARFMGSARFLLSDDELFQIFGKALINIHKRAAELEGKSRWADKNPENVLYLELWKQLLGNDWLFIHVVRNPLDTIASMVEAIFKHALPSSLEDKITFYKQYTQAGISYTEKHPERAYRIIYENLVSYPEKEINKLMHWLGEKAENEQLNFNSFIHQGGLEDPKIKYTKNIHTESINRWRRTLSPSDAKIITKETNLLWKKLDTLFLRP